MTPKQKIKSIEKKMERIKNNNKDSINCIDSACRVFYDIKRYYNLRLEKFAIEFEIERQKQKQ